MDALKSLVQGVEKHMDVLEALLQAIPLSADNKLTTNIKRVASDVSALKKACT